jgi:hypothetical protein
MTVRLRVISLGAGVQSTTMALMAAHREIEPMPDCAIFADTGAEPQGVYDHLRWITSPNVLPFPVHIVSGGNLRDHVVGAMAGEHRMDARPPFFNVTGGPINRQCTTKHKIAPITRRVRDLAEISRNDRAPAVEQWIGISTDEASRMKPARDAWQVNRWPLIERKMSRRDCLGWLDRRGYPTPPKSACTFCPYRNTENWRKMKSEDPESFADAVAIDKLIRPGMPGSRRPQSWFIHYSCRPLDEIDFSTPEERGQLDLFNNECEGMCGV